jgi:hypothetical protein
MASSSEWFQRLLAGFDPSEADLRKLIADCPHEDEFVEYKSAAWLQGPTAASSLREYVAGFANVSGGLLVLGFDPRSGSLSDTATIGRTAAQDFVAEATAPLRPYFHFPPRIRTVPSATGTSIVVVVPRSLTLVPISKGNSRTYWARWGATTQPLPEDLALDILLGRRRNPYLRLRLKAVDYRLLPVDIGDPNVRSFGVAIAFEIENAGLVFAEAVRAGLVGWVLSGGGVPDSLNEAIDASEPRSQMWRGVWQRAAVGHFRNASDQGVGGFRGGLDLAPFDTCTERFSVSILPAFPDHSGMVRPGDAEWTTEARGGVRWLAAVYLVAKNAEPLWYQFSLEYSPALLQVLGGPDHGPLGRCALQPVAARPQVTSLFAAFG